MFRTSQASDVGWISVARSINADDSIAFTLRIQMIDDSLAPCSNLCRDSIRSDVLAHGAGDPCEPNESLRPTKASCRMPLANFRWWKSYKRRRRPLAGAVFAVLLFSAS
jgi:hypothetical protein